MVIISKEYYPKFKEIINNLYEERKNEQIGKEITQIRDKA